MQRPQHTPGKLRKGNRELLFRYTLLAFLITALTVVLLVRFYKQQRYQKVYASVQELAETRQQKNWIGHAIQTLYAAENHFRFFTLTYQNEYLRRYTASLDQVAADLDSLQQYKKQAQQLAEVLAEREEKGNMFIRIKRATDSLIALNAGWDTSLQRQAFQPIPDIQFRQRIQVDTIQPVASPTPVKRKKLFGRIADAIANRPRPADSTAPTNIVKTTVGSGTDPESRQYNQQQLKKINEYYAGVFRKIGEGQLQLNRQEYEMVAANDRMLNTLQEDLHSLQRQEAEAALVRQRAQADGINSLLDKWNRDTFTGTWLIALMLALILALIYITYKTTVNLNRARLDALRFSKLKSDFVSNMSHEIRTPLGSVIGFTEQLKNTPLEGRQEEMVDAIQLSSSMLLSVVNNVLDFSKLEEGKLELTAAPFSPRQIVEEVTKGMQVQAEKKRISLRERFGFSGGEMVEGDAFRLKQVLVNLVSNAVKFTPDGGSVLIDAVLFSRNDQRHLEVAVQDTGIGIPPKQLKVIFEEYTQVPFSDTGADGPKGSGLGLAIVKKIIDLHGGTVKVESKPGEGSVFRFTIPYKTATASTHPAAAPVAAATAPPEISRALIVEDNALNRRLLEIILSRLNIAHATATNGAEGLAMIREQQFDIVFSDISMPEMDGLTLIRHIRQLKDPQKANMPVIAITGNAVKDELDLYMAAGFNSYIVKPFRETDVVEKINATRGGLMPQR